MAKDRNRLFIAIANIGPTTGIDDKLVRERNNKLKSLANGSDPEAAFAYGVDYILHGLEFPSLTNAKYVYAHTAEAYAQIRPIIRKNEQNNRSLTELEKDLNERWGVQVALDLESEEELGRIGWELFDQIARTFPLLKKLNKHTPGYDRLESNLKEALVKAYAKKILTIENTKGVRISVSHPESALSWEKYDYETPTIFEITIEVLDFSDGYHPEGKWVAAKNKDGQAIKATTDKGSLLATLEEFISNNQEFSKQTPSPLPPKHNNLMPKPEPRDAIERMIGSTSTPITKKEKRDKERDKAEAELDEIKKEYEKQLEKLTKLHDEFEPFLEPYVGTPDQEQIKLEIDHEVSQTVRLKALEIYSGISERRKRKALIESAKKPLLALYKTKNERIKVYCDHGQLKIQNQKFEPHTVQTNDGVKKGEKRWINYPPTFNSSLHHHDALRILKQELAKAIQHNRDKRGRGIKGFFGASVGITIGLGTLFSAAHENVSVDDVIAAAQNDNTPAFVMQDENRAFTL